MEVEQVGVTRSGRNDGTGADETDDASSHAVCGRWCISRNGSGRGSVSTRRLEGHGDRDGREDRLARVGIVENGKDVVCKCARDGDCESGGGEEEERVGEGEDW